MTFNPTAPVSALDLALDQGALFEVKTEPVAIAGTVPTIGTGSYAGQPERIAHYRTLEDGTVKLLNVAHPSHPSSNYLQVIEAAEALFPESTTQLEVLEDGAKLFFTQELGEPVDLGGGDEVAPHLLWRASLDSSWSTGAHGLSHRFFCTNQIPMAKSQITVRRTTNHDLRLAERSVILAQAMDRFDRFMESVSTLKRIPVNAREFSQILDRLVPAPQPDAEGKIHGKTANAYDRKIAAVRYYFGEESDGPAGGTAWAVYNAFQSAEFHSFTEGKNKARKMAEIAAEGKHSALSTQALELLTV